jgi:hypothetical protein
MGNIELFQSVMGEKAQLVACMDRLSVTSLLGKGAGKDEACKIF